jgi:hypothetical protein
VAKPAAPGIQTAAVMPASGECPAKGRWAQRPGPAALASRRDRVLGRRWAAAAEQGLNEQALAFAR